MAELANLKTYIVNPLIKLIFFLALAYFLFGIVMFIANYASEEGRKTGKKHLFWGIVGLAIMISVYGILNILNATIKSLAGG